MASQRRAPTKRPPRPASKKAAPPPEASEGSDATESSTATRATGPTPTTSPTAKKSPPNTPKTSTSGTARSTSGTPRSSTSDTSKSSTTKSSTTKSSTTKTGSAVAAKGAPSGAPKTSPSGPNYRPPSGAARTRLPPPPRRKKKRATKKTLGAIVALIAIGAVVVFFSFQVNTSSNTSNTTSLTVNAAASGPEGVAIPGGTVLAAPDSGRYPQTIDSIKCQTNEQVAYHIHVHLTIFVNGKARQVPYGIGIAPPLQFTTQGGTFIDGGTCFYWLHTHASDGIIHVESPTTTTYNLGNFFDVWGQPLNSGQIGPAIGKLTVFVDGKPYAGDPRLIPLDTHSQIQIDEGSPVVAAQPQITFPSGL